MSCRIPRPVAAPRPENDVEVGGGMVFRLEIAKSLVDGSGHRRGRAGAQNQVKYSIYRVFKLDQPATSSNTKSGGSVWVLQETDTAAPRRVQ